MKNFIKRTFLITIFCLIIFGFGIMAYYVNRFYDNSVNLEAILIEDNKISKVFFSPDDNIKMVLIGLIDAEKSKIITAIYTITDKDIVKAFLNAHKRGVILEFVVDRGYGCDRYSKVPQLANARIPVWVYQTNPDDKNGSLLHHKFCIFENNILNKTILWTGSYNFTARASNRNQENALVLDDPKLIKRFYDQFEILKKRSLLISGNSGMVFDNCEVNSRSELPSFWRSLCTWCNQIFSY